MSNLNPLKPSERMKVARQEPSEQAASDRVTNFLEVSFGFDEDRTIVESTRCLECKEPKCVDGCPVEIDIKGFIQLILQKDYLGAVRKIREANYLPAICGRVCPQESQCEELCVLGKKLTPVAIGKLERFVADYEMRQGLFEPPVVAEHRPEKVAIVGSGPAGLTCAAELAKLGYGVTIFEALHAV
ncbi:MAG: Glutamate synthase small chain, partial [candidate division NC10 bacterium]|nr:Glutamate synthase small chain [candidate division NC10 bacterium]